MKHKRIYRAAIDDATGKIVQRMTAAVIYDEISDAVQSSGGNTRHGLFGLPLAYEYDPIMRWIARDWACTKRDLERAYPKCREVYDEAVRDYFIHQALRYAREAYDLAKALDVEKADSEIAKAAARYKEFNENGTRRVIRCEGGN
jgi:hypothetical protein